MFVELEEKDIKDIERLIGKFNNNQKRGNLIEINSLIGTIQDAICTIENLQEEIEDLKKDIEDNYKLITTSEQVDIDDRYFI